MPQENSNGSWLKEKEGAEHIQLHRTPSQAASSSSSSIEDYEAQSDSSPFLYSLKEGENSFDRVNRAEGEEPVRNPQRRRSIFNSSSSIPALFTGFTTAKRIAIRFSPPLSSKRQTFLYVLFIVLLGLVLNTLWHPPPPYDILPSSSYQSKLNQSIHSSFPVHLRQRLEIELTDRLSINSSRASKILPESLMPSTLFQTDVRDSTHVEYEQSWKRAGATRRFLDDQGAYDYVHESFKEGAVLDVYDFLPVNILKSDFLRYATLLVDGGIYSDMDTRVLMPVDEWFKGAKVWGGEAGLVDTKDSSDGGMWAEAKEPKQVQSEPIRFLVGIENDPSLWHSARNM